MIDTVRLNINAGSGGNGCSSFLREKYRPKGGPNGGDGGDGGSAYLVGDTSINTLLHIKFNSTIYVVHGGHGKGKNKRGGNGEDRYIPVPMGTVIYRMNEEGEKEYLDDITSAKPRLIAVGGRGGWGNTRFATPTNQEPVLAQRGEKGEKVVLFLELKLLADVGLLAKPNAGKSTLISMCSAAKTKVADYPFTTVEPVLGVVRVGDDDFVMMEVPGLLEGAHEGIGLGHEFLRHAERARLYVHMLDGLSEDPVNDYRMINQELEQFNPEMAEKPQLVVINKLDVTEVREAQDELTERLMEAIGDKGSSVQFISAATGEGVDTLMGSIFRTLAEMPVEVVEEGPELEPMRTRPQRSAGRENVWRASNGVYVVESEMMERLTAMADTRDQRVLLQLWREMRKTGLATRLIDAGIEAGDTIRFGKVELTWF
ncbi:MAG: GTPase ObgE [SAR202 cluster bacterium]|jgi:GTP-binding protein|nr:GTPase ObgE [Dehalococcoidia bacterium]MQF87540.1 GTPase ObgE [SAR202 cluster bacterium]|tara:strand:- start:2950 stop:4233 length:1284 start_codon:yes stop_codon:yes gene_type:complete